MRPNDPLLNTMGETNIVLASTRRSKSSSHGRYEHGVVGMNVDVNAVNAVGAAGPRGRDVEPSRSSSRNRQRRYQHTRVYQEQGEHHRPRPISTGRMMMQEHPIVRHQPPSPFVTIPSPSSSSAAASQHQQKSLDEQESNRLTRDILEMKERRSQAHILKLKRETLRNHPLHQRRTKSIMDEEANHSGHQEPPGRAPSFDTVEKHRSQSVELNDKYMTRDDNRVIHASLQDEQVKYKLKDAEGRIGSLMQELEDLRFFHEIDMAPASPRSPSTPVSPARSTPERRRILSPRRLASLDRNSLELEAQELQRRVEMLETEKSSLEATVAMCEKQQESQSEDAARIKKIESSLREISATVSHQIQQMDASRAKLTEEYETKLEAVRKKYKSACQECDGLTSQLIDAKDSLQSMENELDKFQKDTRQEVKKQAKAWKEKEEDYELQLADSTMQLENTQQSLEDKKRENKKLRRELDEAKDKLHSSLHATEAEHMESMRDVERALEALHDQHSRLQVTHKETTLELESKNDLVGELRSAEESHRTQLNDLQEKFQKLDSVYLAKMEDFKKSFETREQRRLDDLVLNQHNKNMDYEALLSDMRKQLSHATDRHQKDMEEKEVVMKEQTEQRVKDAKEKVTQEYEAKIAALQQELREMNERYDKAIEESLRHQVESESMTRDAAREWDRKEALRQGQLDRLNEKLDRSTRDIAERDTKIQSLQERLDETEERSKGLASELGSMHHEESKVREELLSQQKLVTKLRADLVKRDAAIVELQASTEERVVRLESELDATRKQVDCAIRKDKDEEDQLRSRLASTQLSLEKLQKDLISEQARHESLESEMRVELAKLEGKLLATESTLKDKRSHIEQLEVRLASVDEESSVSGTKLQATIAALQRDLEATRELVNIEQTTRLTQQKEFEEKEMEYKKHQEDAKTKRGAYTRKIESLQAEIKTIQEEKEGKLTKLTELQEKLKDAEGRVVQTEAERAATHEELTSELRQKQKEHEETVVVQERLIEDLTSKVAAKEELAKQHETELDKIKVSLKNAVDVSMNRSTEVVELQGKVQELERKLDDFQETSSRIETDSKQSIQTLEQKLKDADQRRSELTGQIKVISKERADAVEALEKVIREVHIREGELEELTDVIAQREEELDNAKLIATKAIASAQDFKTRYKEKGARENDRNAEYQIMIDELNASIEYLSGKNDKLKAKAIRLEEELHEKNLECVRLRDELKESITDTASGWSPKAKSGKGQEAMGSDPFFPMDPDGPVGNFVLMESGFKSSSTQSVTEQSAASSLSEGGLMESMSTNSADLGKPTTWLEDFGGDIPPQYVGKSDSRSESGSSGKVSKRSAERDALRKYVRKRYLKKNGDDSTKSPKESEKGVI